MIERWWKRRHYSKPGPRHHPTRLKEAVTSGYGEPKQARCRKRRIQPRGHLRTDRGFLYSETACLKYQVAFARFPGRKAASRFMFTAEETCPFCRIFFGGRIRLLWTTAGLAVPVGSIRTLPNQIGRAHV